MIFVYNRPEHTKRLLQSLKLNDLSKDSDIYVFSDGPKEGSINDEGRVDMVRGLITRIDWNKSLQLIEQEKNKGLADSVIEGLSFVFDRYDKAIVLEDDLVLSPNFISYSNEMLDEYKDEDKIAGVSGFSYVPDHANSDLYVLPIGCSWGWSTWKRTWNDFEFDTSYLIDEILDKKLASKFDYAGYPFFKMLQAQLQGKVNSWAIRFYASFFLKDKYFIFPNRSLVLNTGFDELATHTLDEHSNFQKVRTDSNKNLKIEKTNKSLDDLIRIGLCVEQEFELRYVKSKAGSFLSRLLKWRLWS